MDDEFKKNLEKFKKMAKSKNIEEKPQVIVVGRSNVGKSTLVRLITKKNVRVGKKPGVTLKINKYDMGNYILVDLPGFGFMTGLDDKVQDKIKDEIVKYIEDNKEKIACSIILIDAKAFPEIVDRWDKRDEIPIDIEMFDFLNELKLNPIILINKMDKIKKNLWDEHLDDIVELFGYPAPWRQWLDMVVIGILKDGEGLKDILYKINYHVSLYIKRNKK
ncbi:GTP-binding protein EngB [Methanothermococcus okinawensis]|uniref:Probable GTP-binding protein EngB n=1 Tax=Methanothermococcus okinawensis (strain DSM 14208 / JCM 11175 / IH1) TaxID=647113 RepID=F8ALJ5_METOI|nr:GTP-binding protein EngB [Methanothermococcus okinawensis]AEH07151.1 GTP-binding protein engB [Methanothermococcus okinawensis IH1]